VVQTIGMVYAPDAKAIRRLSGNPNPERVPLLLYRFEITCCAADARPRAVILTGVPPQAHVSDTWLRITGNLVPSAFVGYDSGGLPVLDATKVEVIPVPKHPFLERVPW
jgi:uncharacterized membrane protein YcgQ (UPF0703/DUF1980 family)